MYTKYSEIRGEKNHGVNCTFFKLNGIASNSEAANMEEQQK